MLVVPELPEEIRALKERARAFVESEVYPLEQQIARSRDDRPGAVDDAPPHGLGRPGSRC